MRLLIVDDEAVIARGIQHVVQKMNTPFQTVEIAFSGKEALSKLVQSCYDFLLTDITMPGMNGLELIAQAKESSLCGTFGIISGYSEFEFARTAMQLGVSDYLVKPVDKEKLAALLDHAADTIRKKREQQRRAEENRLSGFFFGKYGNEEIGLSGQKPWCVMLADDSLNAQADLSYPVLAQLCRPELAAYIIPAPHICAAVLICKPEHEKPLLEQLRKLSKLHPSVSVGTARGKGADAPSLKTLFNGAVQAALYAKYFFNRFALDASEFEPLSFVNFMKAQAQWKEKYKISVQESQYANYKACARMFDRETQLEPGGEQNSNQYVRQMLEMIARDFSKDLSLKDVSRKVALNAEYAGKLFKAETGTSFLEYLNRYRITCILEYMTQNPDIVFEQVAPSMGFSDTRNFYRIFKRILNMTPGEYKKQMVQGGNCPKMPRPLL